MAARQANDPVEHHAAEERERETRVEPEWLVLEGPGKPRKQDEKVDESISGTTPRIV